MIGSPQLATVRHLGGLLGQRIESVLEAEFPRINARRVILGTAGIAIVLGAIGLFVQPAIGTLIIAIGLIPWLWAQPVRGIYLLVGICALIEQFPLGFPDSLTDRIPLWLNLNDTAGIPLSVTPFEILLGIIAVITALRGCLTGRLHLTFGRLTPAYYAFAAVLLLAEVNGLLTGGDFKLSLWELRPQAYAFIVFLLTGALVRERRQVITLGVVFFVAEAMKAILGDWRYLVTMGRQLGSHETLLGHEDSYFLLLFLVAMLIGLVWWRHSRRFWVPMLIGAPVAALALIANERRAGILALVVTLFLCAVLVIRHQKKRVRRVAIVVCAVAALGLTGLVATSWNQQYGIRSAIVSPVRTVLDPANVSARNQSSDQYRTAENSNLQFTFKLSPLVGYGFGKTFLTPTPMADISQLYSLWNVIPHNTLLWVPMRMGLLGMVTFWGLVGMALIEAIRGIRTVGDRLLQGLSAFITCAIVGELLFAYADLQLENPRNMVAWGVLLGLVNVLPRLAAQRKGAASLEAIDAAP